MNLKLRKAFKDLTTNPKRTLLVIFALILGIWGVGTVLTSYVVLSNDLAANYQSTKPLHVVLESRDFDRLNLEGLIASSEIESAEFRDFSLDRIEVEPNVWVPLWLYGVENFENYNLAEIFKEEGSKTPATGTILIERDCKRITNIQTGSTVRLRIGSNVQSVSVSGICFDPAQAPATQDLFVYAYTDKQTFSQITGLPINQRLIIRFNNVDSESDVRKQTDILINELKQQGIEITSTEIPQFNAHPHQWQLNTLIFLIGSIGLLAFLMAAVLVSQLVKSILASQVRQIGILKAIGASRYQVFQIYVSMLLIIGLLSGIVAIPLAMATSDAFVHFVALKLNFNIITTTIPVYIYLILILSSLALPVLLSFPTLLKGTRISVKEAFSDYGISQGMDGNLVLFKKMKLPYLTVLAIRNSQRNMKRLSITIMAMALGVAVFSTGFNVRQSLWNLLTRYDKELKYDIQVALSNPISEQEAVSHFSSIANLKSMETWTGGQIEGKHKMIASDKGAVIIAVPFDSKMLNPNITQGKWISSGKQEIVLNENAWLLYKKPSVGSMVDIVVNGRSMKAELAGVVKQYEKPRIYIDKTLYNSFFNPDKSVNTVVFSAEDNNYDKVLNMKKDIEDTIASSDMQVSYVMSQAERVKIVYDHLNIILYMIVVLSFLVLVVSAIGMASSTGINIMERTREIGVMRAIGATPKKIYTLFVSEGMITSILSIVIGLILAYPLSYAASAFFGTLMLGEDASLGYAFSPLGFVVTLVATILFGWIASRLPAKSAIKLSTYKALQYE